MECHTVIAIYLLTGYQDKLVRMEGATCEKCKQFSDTVSLRCSDENLCKDCDQQRLGKQQEVSKVADEVEAEEAGSHLGNYATASAPSMDLVTTDAECENSMTEEDEGTEPVNEGFLVTTSCRSSKGSYPASSCCDKC